MSCSDPRFDLSEEEKENIEEITKTIPVTSAEKDKLATILFYAYAGGTLLSAAVLYHKYFNEEPVLPECSTGPINTIINLLDNLYQTVYAHGKTACQIDMTQYEEDKQVYQEQVKLLTAATGIFSYATVLAGVNRLKMYVAKQFSACNMMGGKKIHKNKSKKRKNKSKKRQGNKHKNKSKKRQGNKHKNKSNKQTRY